MEERQQIRGSASDGSAVDEPGVHGRPVWQAIAGVAVAE